MNNSKYDYIGKCSHALQRVARNYPGRIRIADSDDDPDDAGRVQRLFLRRIAGGWKLAALNDIKPGDTIAVPTAYGGCDEFGFSPNAKDFVTDLSARARGALDRSAQVVITERWLASIGVDEERRRVVWRRVQNDWRTQVAPADILAALLGEISDAVSTDLEWLKDRPVIDSVVLGNGDLYAFVTTENIVKMGDVSDEDLSSSRTLPVALTEHNAGVGRRARELSLALSLEASHVEDLARAGSLHDVGKADPRFQQLLRAGNATLLAGQLLAKSIRGSRVNRIETSERHEAYSVAFLKRYPDLLRAASDPELVLYLIGTHHGRGRSLMPDRIDEGTSFVIEVDGTKYEFDGVPALGALGSGWPTLFWRLNSRYGPWGLAYLESILRLADWLRSAEELGEGLRS